MIPVLGIPVLNRPDLLRSCLRSIDTEVGRLIIIDNSGTGEMGDAAMDELPLTTNLVIVDAPHNLGVAASWNLIIRSTVDAPWWCIVGADTRFGRGDLETLAGAMLTDEPAVRCLFRFGAFGINLEAVRKVGWFDENFHPIYCEDADYEYRLRLAGYPDRDIPTSMTEHAEGGSVTYRSDPELAARNRATYPSNVDYYRRKWGGSLRGGEAFATPFNRGGSIRDWTLEIDRLRDNDWGKR